MLSPLQIIASLFPPAAPKEERDITEAVERLKKPDTRTSALREQYERMARHQGVIEAEANAQCNLR